MAKRIQLLLNQDVSKLGRKGDVVEVAPGYARNFLIPQNLGVNTTPGILKQVERRKAKEAERLAKIKQEAEDRKKALESVGRFKIAKPLGEGDSIFGTVTDREMAEAILASTGQDLDRRGITMPEINKLGIYKVQVKVHAEVTAEVEVHVTPL
ncbi:MAG: 50S ribosomal protein L9 [Coleofasciculaceae cyanobacterium RL_1_1]|jgi:large subunit ribosomal protein L9|nr:50S ribosomal protein L9 [Coleofasciculaceae cyanobacterium RL_1_1]